MTLPAIGLYVLRDYPPESLLAYAPMVDKSRT